MNYPYALTDPERQHLNRLVDYASIECLPEVWAETAIRFGEIVALHSPHATPEIKLTYRELWQQIQQFASGLQALGAVDLKAEPPTRIALFADNSPRWFIADQGIMTAGAADVVRGATADPEELLYILANSGSTSVVLENRELLNKLRTRLQDLPMQLVVLLSDEEDTDSTLPVVKFSQVLATGADRPRHPVSQTPKTLATLLYTSGTTGKPKGVMLTHANLIHQITTLISILAPTPGDCVLSILPSWHSYERAAEYFLLSQGCTQIYTSIRTFKQDFKTFKPHYMASVPRLWESVYEGVQKQFREQPASKQKLVNFFLSHSQNYILARRVWRGWVLSLEPPTPGQRFMAGVRLLLEWPLHTLGNLLVYGKVRAAIGGRFKCTISGGGSLAQHLDDFFETVGITLLVGYGLTETSPVLTARRLWRNISRSAGQPIPGTELKIVHPETRQALPPGQQGLVLARGPQIMEGYYQNPEATAKAIDPDGWFNTGDLGWMTPEQDLILTGRAKDTIVLTNGENIEPQPIEDACIRSPYIDQIMLVGQDQKLLGALIVPNQEALQAWASEQNLSLSLPGDLTEPAIQDLFRRELNREVKNRPGYRADDRIGPFRLILEPFSQENGMLTQTLKLRRPVVMERYRDMINGMF